MPTYRGEKGGAFLALLLIVALGAPVGDVQAEAVIHLKNGGRLTARQVWREGNMIMFTVPGGTMGIEQRAVKGIARGRGP
ncbi:MAG: hypothetical protein N2Z74_07915, partial [Syntrophales bacterium]|nr:hypothetical protein [Syntrophales bacterium]